MANKLLILLSIIAIIFACGEEKKDTKPQSKSKKTTVAVDGKEVYNKNCVICHGTKGDMGSSGAANLTVSKLNLEERIAVITNGRNTMAAYKDLLKEEEIKAVAEYTMKLTKEAKDAE